MKKEFLPYEEALTLKELGFNELCIGRYYTKNKELPIFMQWTKAEDFNSVLLPMPYGKNKISPFISAPLYQQAFRWFLEKYNLDGSCSVDVWNTKKTSWRITGGIEGVIFANDEDDLYDWDGWDYYDSYEEAQLACLRQLIKIVKDGLKK